MWRILAVLIVYPLLHLPLLLLNVWPVVAGVIFGWGIATLGVWALWSIPFAFFVIWLDRWPWWKQLRANLLAWGRLN